MKSVEIVKLITKIYDLEKTNSVQILKLEKTENKLQITYFIPEEKKIEIFVLKIDLELSSEKALSKFKEELGIESEFSSSQEKGEEL